MQLFSFTLGYLLLLLPALARPDRSDTLIGYKEVRNAATEERCHDTHDECRAWQKADQCLVNPYYMRLSCPNACKVPACFKAATLFWKGYATEYHTRQYHTRMPGVQYIKADRHFRRDTSMGNLLSGHSMRSDPWLTLSSLGTGTYLGSEDEDTDEQVASAIITSIQRGWNVIDTASNYRGGRGEKAVGYALDALRDLKGFTREMVFVSTKAGFLQEDIKEQLLANQAIGSDDIVGGMHCMHPACLQQSLARSLLHLRLETVDLLYLHNPAEMQLSRGTDRFMTRLKAAFSWAEEAREKGLIRAYGLATWGCFRSAPGTQGYLSLLDVVQLAQQVGGRQHGFRYVQLPINAAMAEAWTQLWQPIPLSPDDTATTPATMPGTFMEAAGRLRVGVFGSGPLQEAALLQQPALQERLLSMEELKGIDGAGPKLLQIARSTPGLISSLVGHKTKEHVLANIAVSNQQPLQQQEVAAVVAALAA